MFGLRRKFEKKTPPVSDDRWELTSAVITQEDMIDGRHLIAVVDHATQVPDVLALMQAWVSGPVANPASKWLSFVDLSCKSSCAVVAEQWGVVTPDGKDSPVSCAGRILQARRASVATGAKLGSHLVVAMPVMDDLADIYPALSPARSTGMFLMPIITSEAACEDAANFTLLEDNCQNLLLAPHAIAPGLQRNFTGSLQFFRQITHKTYY